MNLKKLLVHHALACCAVGLFIYSCTFVVAPDWHGIGFLIGGILTPLNVLPVLMTEGKSGYLLSCVWLANPLFFLSLFALFSNDKREIIHSVYFSLVAVFLSASYLFFEGVSYHIWPIFFDLRILIKPSTGYFVWLSSFVTLLIASISALLAPSLSLSFTQTKPLRVSKDQVKTALRSGAAQLEQTANEAYLKLQAFRQSPKNIKFKLNAFAMLLLIILLVSVLFFLWITGALGVFFPGMGFPLPL